MQKVTSSATALLVGDRIKFGGRMYEITNLNLHYGRGRDRVSINVRPLDETHEFSQLLSGPATSTFTVYRKK